MFIGRFAGQQELYQPGTARQVESGQLTFGVQGRGVQSRRDCISQPRVARNELPWVSSSYSPQPCKGCINWLSVNTRAPNMVEERQDERAATLSGLVGLLFVSPKVARSSQPWAE